MGIRVRVASTVALVLSCLAVAPVGGASGAAIDPGEFTVTMNNPQQGSGGGGTQPTITCSANGMTTTLQNFFDNVVGRWSQAGNPPTVSCSSKRETVQTNASLTGTVVNVNLGSGSMNQTCDMKQTVEMTFDVVTTMSATQGQPATVSVSNVRNSLNGFQACAWAMAFTDAKSSRLSGTIEQVSSFSGEGQGVACPPQYQNMQNVAKTYCIPINTSASVFVVGGTGYFADTSGTGSFSHSDIAPIMLPVSSSVKVASVRLQAFVFDSMASLLQANTSDTADGLKMSLLKGAKSTVRLVSPAKVGGKRSLGTGPDGSTLVTVKMSAAPGAKCGVTAKSGTKAKSVLTAKKDSDGVITTAITSATLKKSLAVKAGAKVMLSVYCAVPSGTAKSDQSVTIDN
ncbi:MAG: hypothetical protein EBT79_09230 [Actinobacteria bacterium]|nr:hypothetical protein [Actinomycetota bacterium]